MKLRRLGSMLVAGGFAAACLTALPAPASAAPKFKKADTGASISAYKWLNSRTFDFAVKSPSLGATQKVRVLVPKGWKYKSTKKWPVVYLLHGGKDTYVSWTRSTKIEQLAAKWKVIVVMPEGSNGSYANWYNDGRGGIPKWETFHTQEVRQLMERNYGAGSNRAIIGNSSGGGGAMTYAARYPTGYKYVASFSGILSMLSPGVPEALSYVNSTNGVPNAIYGDPVKNRDNWLKHDPYALAPRLKNTTIFFSSGTGGISPDAALFAEFVTGYTAADFKERLQALKIKHTSHIYTGGKHSWGYWWRELQRAWPTAMKTIKAGKA